LRNGCWKKRNASGFLYQAVVVHEIALKFGDEFTYINANGNTSVRKDVLSAFRKLSGNAVVWERSERMWRKRQPHDGSGRLQ
jgi:hypothetical protein